MSHTQAEILARIEAVADDYFGFRREVLITALDYEHASARGLLSDGVTEDEWNAVRTTDFAAEARDYLTFAIGKIQDHRGISASRSVGKLGEYAWLLGRDDVLAAMDAAEYAQYGAPKVKAFALGMGYDWPADAELERMASGLPCHDECLSGCG